MATAGSAIVVFLWAVLVSVCHAGEYCYTSSSFYSYSTYCLYGCCGYNNQDCCSSPVGLIVGLSVGGAVFLFFIILTICLCRRRRYAGVVYQNQPAGGVIVAQQTNMSNQSGMVTTGGVQPGITYPPYPQYQYYSSAPGQQPGYPAVPTSPPGYPPQQGYQSQPGYPPQPAPYGAEPPKYDSLHLETGGISNQGYEHKN